MAKSSYDTLTISEKYCNCCKQTKSVTEFYLCDTSRMKDGLQNFCKECTNLKRRLKNEGVVDINSAIADYYGFKFCTGCVQYLPKSDFWKGGEIDNLQHYCKECYGKFISRGGSGLRNNSERVYKSKKVSRTKKVSKVRNLSSDAFDRTSDFSLDYFIEPVVKFKSLLESYSMSIKDFFDLVDFYNSCPDDSKNIIRKVL